MGFIPPFDTASCNEGELDVRAALASIYPVQACSALRNSIVLETDGCLRSALRNSIVSRDRRMYWFILPLTLKARPRRGTRRPGSPSSPYIPSRPVAHRATPLSPETDGCIGLSSSLTLLARLRGEPDVRSPSSPYIPSRPQCREELDGELDVRASFSSISCPGPEAPRNPSSPGDRRIACSAPRNSIVSETDGCAGLSFRNTAISPQKHRATPSSRDRRMYWFIPPLTLLGNAEGEPDVRGSLDLHILHCATPSSRDRRMYWFILSFDTASKAERGTDVRAALVSIYPVQACRGTAQLHRLETDGCIGLSSLTLLTDVLVYPSLDTASKAERGTKRPGSPVLHISRPGLVAHCAQPIVSRDRRMPVAQSRNSIISRDRRMYLVYPLLDTASKAERGTDVRAALVSIYPVKGLSVAAGATHRHSRQTDVLGLSLSFDTASKGLREGELDVRAALARSALRNSTSPETDGCIGLSSLTLLARRGGTRRPGAALVSIYPVQARSAPRNSIVTSRQTDVLTDGCIGLSLLLDTASKGRERGTRRPGSPSSPYIPSRLVAHRATPSSLETDGCIGLSSPWTLLARPRGNDVRAALVLHISCPGPLGSAPRNSIVTSRQTDVLVYPLLWTLLAKAERGTRRPGSPSSPYILSRLSSALGANSIVSRQTDVLVYPLFGTLRQRPRGELDVRAALVPYPVQARSAPRQLHRLSRDGCIGLSSPWTLLARPRGELDVRAALVLHISRPGRSAPRNSIVSRQTDVLVYPFLGQRQALVLIRPRGEPDVRADPVLHISCPGSLVAHRANSIVSRDRRMVGLSLLWTLLARLRGGKLDVRQP
ncbi:unnamed protein product [Acanthosepion pharaonis]|uniref:Uncharacterized protein n=1 Tax=Acanthosepion pharaonis TaxID=158019 RepID=A0A812E4V6_ACAPH|nr:unnamed protein product [Sepia pharaonis]